MSELLVPEAFAALGVRPSILRSLAECGFVEPTEIQKMVIPRALAGVDVLGQARTGTGKTAAFAIPILQKCLRDGPAQAIVLVPTRELAIQVDAEFQRLGKYTPIRSIPVYGGQKITAQIRLLRKNPQVVIGTPGRVIDLLNRGIMNLRNARFVVLDEVDRMLDIGFRDDVRNILGRIRNLSRPQTKEQTSTWEQSREDGLPQTIFVSATISEEIEHLARTYMREPVEKLIVSGTDEKPTVKEVDQYYLSVQPWDKYRLLKMLLAQENPDLAIIFCKTKHTAHKLARRLQADGVFCREIHSNLNQNERQKVMRSFRGGKFDVLVATDLASRGIDVAGISHIINYDIPEDPEVYVHRVGRTARMGAAGKAFTFVTPDQGQELTRIEHLVNMLIPQTAVEGFSPSPPPMGWEESADSSSPRTVPPPATGNAQAPPAVLRQRPLTLGSKIPLTRRTRRRRR